MTVNFETLDFIVTIEKDQLLKILSLMMTIWHLQKMIQNRYQPDVFTYLQVT